MDRAPGEWQSALQSFRLLEEIGSGSTGTVHRGVLLEDLWGAPAGAEIAVKFLHQGLTGDSAARARFLHEARAGMRVAPPEHGHLVRILSICEENLLGQDLLFLVMNYIPGPTLRRWLTEGRPGNEPLVREVAAQLARALASLHASGVVHLDVKPENVILSSANHAVLMDLGFARQLDLQADAESLLGSPLIQSGSQPFAGSLAYAAPELLRGALPTPLCDLYSLGILMFELLTGTLPFEAQSPEAILEEKLSERSIPVTERAPRVSPFLDEVLQTLLAPRPEVRFSEATQVAELLEQGESSNWWSTRRPAVREARARLAHTLPLIGRGRELADLLRAYDLACAGERRLQVLGGEANMGAARLVEELEHRLAYLDSPPQILEGRCPVRERALPYSSLLSALERFLGLKRGARPSPADIARLGEFCDPASARLLGAALAGTPEPRAELTVPRAFGNFISGLAAHSPLLLILEDFHHAFGPTLQTLELLLEEHREAPLLPIAILRPSQLNPNEKLCEFLERLERKDLCVSTELRSVERGEVRSFVAHVFPPDMPTEPFADALYERTGGAPGFIAEVLQNLAAETVIEWNGHHFEPRQDISEIPVPDVVVRGILQRRAELAPELRLELDRAAVSGQRFDAELLSGAFGGTALEHAHLLGQLAIGRDILVPEGGAYSFVSTGVREVLYADRDPEFLRAAHLHLADAIEQRADRDGAGRRRLLEIAHHAGAGGDHERALHYLLPLARDLLNFGTGSRAAELCRTALEHLEHLPEEERHRDSRLQLLLLHASAAGRTGHRSDEHASAGRAYRLATELGRERERVLALIYLGRHAHRTGNNELALGYLERALAAAQAIDDAELETFARIGMGTAHGYLGQHHEAHTHLLRALAAVTAQPSTREVAVLVGLGRNMLDRERPDEALATLCDALELMETNPDRIQRLRALFQSARALREIGDTRGALETTEQALETERETGDDHMRGFLLSLRGSLQARSEAFAAAHETLTEARILAERIGDRYTLVHTWIHLSNALRAPRNPEADANRALRCAMRATRLADDLDNPRHRAAAHSVQASALLALGRHAAARRSSEHALRLHRCCRFDSRRRMAILHTHATVLEQAGDPAAHGFLARCLRLRQAWATRLRYPEHQRRYLEEEPLSRMVHETARRLGLTPDQALPPRPAEVPEHGP